MIYFDNLFLKVYLLYYIKINFFFARNSIYLNKVNSFFEITLKIK